MKSLVSKLRGIKTPVFDLIYDIQFNHACASPPPSLFLLVYLAILQCGLRPASWSSGQGLWLLIMSSRVRFPVLASLQGKIPVVTMVWVVSRFRLKAPPGISSSCISPLTSSGQRIRASWASQPQKSATLSPQPGGKPRKFIGTCGGIFFWRGGNSVVYCAVHITSRYVLHSHPVYLSTLLLCSCLTSSNVL